MKYLLIAALMLPVSANAAPANAAPTDAAPANAAPTDAQIDTCAKISKGSRSIVLDRYNGVTMPAAYLASKGDILTIQIVKAIYSLPRKIGDKYQKVQIDEFESKLFAHCIQSAEKM
ncbi:MAG: hypothetical protein GY799_06385 [Desulfobulbaceae bacterium]|nr:hypothetical protein [Desulfobulbaceae bacterium]